jgi:hypothetical protein
MSWWRSAIIVLAIGLAVPIFQNLAIAGPTASPAALMGNTTGSLSAVAKANLIAKLKAVKLQEKEARKSGPQDKARIDEWDKKIYDINVLITKIGNNEDVPMGDVDKALASAHTP